MIFSFYKTILFILGWVTIMSLPPPIKYIDYQEPNVGDRMDSLNGVYVYYNDNVKNVSGRNTAPDGYNLGLKYQCVEFVKRYYYEHFNHKMPNSYGHAKDFFDPLLKDGILNKPRNLIQYTNPSITKPEVNDIVVFKATSIEPFGHIAIVSQVFDDAIEIIQQNPNPGIGYRERFNLINQDGKWRIESERIVGRLRKK